MTTASEIPFGNRAQSFRITLGTDEYLVTQRFCVTNNAWFCNIAKTSGEPLLSGLMLVTGADLLSQFAYLGIQGQLVVQSDGDEDAVPTYDGLGSTGHVFYVTE